MACTPTPTATQFTTFTSDVVTTSFSTSVTTVAGEQTTIVSQVCLGATVLGTCVQLGQTTIVSTLPGGTSTVQVPFTVTVPTTVTQATATLFASCESTPNSASASSESSPPSPPNSPFPSTSSSIVHSPDSGSSPNSISASSSPSASNPPTSNSASNRSGSAPASTSTPASTTSSVTIFSTPPPTVITSASSSTLADGSVTQFFITVTSTLPPTAVVVPTVVPQTHSNNRNANKHAGTIVGATFGGIIGLAILAGIGYLFWRAVRQRQLDAVIDDILNEKEAGTGSMSPSPALAVKPMKDRKAKRRFLDDEFNESKPYHYGLVGLTNAQALASPPGPGAVSSLPQPSPSSIDSHQAANSPSPFFVPELGRGLSAQSLSPANSRSVSPAAHSVSRDSEPTTLGSPVQPSSRNSFTLANWDPVADGDRLLDDQDDTGTVRGSTEVNRRLYAVNASETGLNETVGRGRSSSGGRPRINTAGVIVHQDGGAIPEEQPGEPLPPVYSPKESQGPKV